MALRELLLPVPPRRLPHARAWNVVFRTAHIAVVGTLLGGHVFGLPPDRLTGWLWASIGTGAALMAIEAYATLDWFMQVSGLLVLLKLALLLLIPLAWDARVPILFTVVAIAGIGSHMPGRYRHYSVYYRRNTRGK
jgi:predicted alpha/beta hydrolase